MIIPKWLLPVISVVAALAVGVSLAFVGANFASKTTADVAAKTETLPVLAPVVTGTLSKSDTALASKGTLPVSKVTGQATVVTPGAVLGSTGLQQALRRVADGHASGDAADTPASGSTATPSPSASATPTSGGGSTGTGSSPTSNDPCSPASGNPPAGCPDGTLHGAIFADTVPPPLDFTIEPFTAPCGTTQEPTGTPGQVDIPVLLHPTVPERFNVQWRTLTDDNVHGSSSWFDTDGWPTDSGDIDRWNSAAAINTPVPDLPALHSCFTVPNVFHTGEIVDMVVDGYSVNPADIGDVRHEYRFRVGGGSVLPQVEAETFASHDYFVAYTESIPSQSVGIHAYDITNAPGSTCAATSGLHEDSAQGERLIGTVNPRSTSLNIPLEYTERVAYGFVVSPGSVTLVCAKWFRGHEVPSFDRTTAYHVSSIIEHAPDALLPVLSVHFAGANSPARDVTASGSTIEGISCGSAQVVAAGAPLVGSRSQSDRRICSVAPNEADDETVDPSQRGELVVTSDVTMNNGQHVTGQFVISSPTESCNDCWMLPSDAFIVPLPADPATDTSMGSMFVIRGWQREGNSGLHSWVSDSQISVDPIGTPPPASLPQLNTDNALTPDTADAVANGAALSYNLQADQDTDYTVTLSGVPGRPTCTFAGASLSVSGHYTEGSRPVPVVFTHLCAHTVYLASVTLTTTNGSTQWGWQSGNNRWPRYLGLTTTGSVVVNVEAAFSYVSGQALDYVSFAFDGHTGSDPVLFNNQWRCRTNIDGEDEQSVPVDGNTLTLHLHYVPYTGLATDPSNDVATCNAANAGTPVDFTVDLDVDTLQTSGVTITNGPLTFTVTVVEAPDSDYRGS